MIINLTKESREKFYSLVSVKKFCDCYDNLKGKPNDFLKITKIPYRKMYTKIIWNIYLCIIN